MWNIRSEDPDITPDVRYPEKVECRSNRDIPGWNVWYHMSQGGRLRVQGVGTPPPDNTKRTSLSGATPSEFSKRTRGALPYPDSLREKHTALVNITPRTIAYPIRICCLDHWLKWASLATTFRQPNTAQVPPPSDGVSKHFCHGFQRTLLNLKLLWWSKSYQNTKT